MCLAEDKNGILWFGTNGGGVCSYDANLNDKPGQGKSFVNYTTNQGLSNNRVSCILEDKSGNMWFGTNGGGLSRYDGNRVDAIIRGDQIAQRNQDDLKILNGKPVKSFTTYTTAQGLADNVVSSIAEDKNGSLWFGTNGGGVSRYEKTGEQPGSFTNFTIAQGLVNNNIFSITPDASGNLWFGEYGGGVSRYDGKSFIAYTTLQGLASNNVLSIAEDKTGNLWFGTQGGGISRYGLSETDKAGKAKTFTSFTTAQGLASNVVRCVTEDRKGDLWFGTDGGGVCCYDGSRVEAIERGDSLALRNQSGLKKENGKLQKSFTIYGTAQGIGNNVVLNITEDQKGNLWFGTYGGGISWYDGKRFRTYTSKQGLGNDIVLCVAEDKTGALWFGTFGGGVTRYDGKFFTTFTTSQGLANNNVFSIAGDKMGNLWFATGGGGLSVLTSGLISKLASGNDTMNYLESVFSNVTTEQGLADDFVTNVAEGKDGKMYIGTNQGISVIGAWKDRDGKMLPAEFPGAPVHAVPIFHNYNQKTGYPVRDINAGQNCLFVDSKGIVWAGTGDDKTALVRFDPSAVNPNTQPPQVVIQAIKINEENICWNYLKDSKKQAKEKQDSTKTSPAVTEEITTFGRVLKETEKDTMKRKFAGVRFDGVSRFYPLPVHLTLPYEHNNLTFEFSAIEPAKPYLVNYRYVLDGYDKTWSPVTKKTNATFGNIYEGTYTFRLMAQSPEGIWSEPITYTFRVQPPWFRTWWMIFVYILSASLFLYSLYQWRTTSLRKDKEVLEQTVVERTAEVTKQKEIADSRRIIAEEQREVIEIQKTEVEKQKDLVEVKQKEILDSIHYARRIQHALLTSAGYFQKYLKDHYFILFKPKDIVSGDFYWALNIPSADGKEGRGLFYLATADCTGHGVPGAFMSMLNISLLNEMIIERRISNPAEVLDMVRKEIIHVLNPEGSEEESKDGMDAVLCCFDFDKMELRFAGANNFVYLLRDGVLSEYKGDKMPVGKYHDETMPFSLHTIQIQKGDIVYTTTDGYPDQFGGPKGKKYKYKQLEENLIALSHLPFADQKRRLEQSFTDWKGNLEQVDDVTIIGIRI